MFESLHNHTTTSDGAEGHMAVLSTAQLHNITTIAFTDHDALPDEATLQTLESYQGPVTWSVGIEVSSGFAQDHFVSGSLHIVGLFVDVHNPALQEHCRLAQEARQKRMSQIVSNLTEQGFIITEAECLSASAGESVGRPHIVSALLSNPNNQKRLLQLREQMSDDSTVREAYQNMENRAKHRGIEEYAYGLLLGDNAYMPAVYVDYLYQLDMDQSSALIRSAGGVSLLAHWWCYSKKLSLETVRGYLLEGRLDGIETIGGPGEESIKAYPALKKLADETGCLVSVGADAHRPADFTRYQTMPCIQDTSGTFANLVQRARPTSMCSNYTN
jgi:predicted metal-dependent phosphoesterase TrpH